MTFYRTVAIGLAICNLTSQGAVYYLRNVKYWDIFSYPLRVKEHVHMQKVSTN